jgi:hypothetical protein
MSPDWPKRSTPRGTIALPATAPSQDNVAGWKSPTVTSAARGRSRANSCSDTPISPRARAARQSRCKRSGEVIARSPAPGCLQRPPDARRTPPVRRRRNRRWRGPTVPYYRAHYSSAVFRVAILTPSPQLSHSQCGSFLHLREGANASRTIQTSLPLWSTKQAFNFGIFYLLLIGALFVGIVIFGIHKAHLHQS